MRTAYDPTSVSPAVVGLLSISEKEALLIHQRAHLPLQGNIVKVIAEKKAILRKEKEQ